MTPVNPTEETADRWRRRNPDAVSNDTGGDVDTSPSPTEKSTGFNRLIQIRVNTSNQHSSLWSLLSHLSPKWNEVEWIFEPGAELSSVPNLQRKRQRSQRPRCEATREHWLVVIVTSLCPISHVWLGPSLNSFSFLFMFVSFLYQLFFFSLLII